MPEIPDFDQIARTIATPYAHAVQEPPDGLDDGGGAGFVLEVSPDEDDLTAAIAEQLRLVWNARGAADVEKLAEEATAKGSEIQTEAFWALSRLALADLDRALRTLDR